MKKLVLMCALNVALSSHSQMVADFENFSLGVESALYGQDQTTDGDTIYSSGNINFENNYNSGWGSFAGWAISNVTDNTTTGWANQFSSITGIGENGSTNYGVCYVSAWEGNRLYNDFFTTATLEGFSVTNTTYAYYAMLDGDSFTKPFGADTNALGVIDGTNGEDWFLLTVFGLGIDSMRTGDSVNFYLADFRFTLDSDDYIVDSWEYVDLSSLGQIKGLEFELHSTDTTGGWGMNNPAYFAMDNLTFYSGIDENEHALMEVYPNPVNSFLNVISPPGSVITIYDNNGKIVGQFTTSESNQKLDLSYLENGIYFLSSISDGLVSKQKVIKN